jgi:hypothetical protein
MSDPSKTAAHLVRRVRDMTDWADITAAITEALSGERETGRDHMTRCWDVLGAADHAQRCVLAHYVADVQDDLDTEVAWDERALAAHARMGEQDLVLIGIPSAAGLLPSLHLNLGDRYLRQGRSEEARRQLEAGIASAAQLGDDGYATMIRTGLGNLRARLDAHV